MVKPILSTDRRLAHRLLDIGAVTFSTDQPFTWASGLKSPIYCDNRLTMGYPDVREDITGGFGALINEHRISANIIIGTATAGIPHAAWLAQHLRLPMAYVRSSPKGHGRRNQIEGKISPGQKAIIIEDLVSTGKSSMAVVDVLREVDINVLAVLAIFSYELPDVNVRFEENAVPLYTLTRFETLIHIAEEKQVLTKESLASLKAWRLDPVAWSQAAMAK